MKRHCPFVVSRRPARVPWHSGTGSLQAFSLVEVTLAIGIVGFALLAILGVYGGMLENSRGNSDRREIGEAIDALRTQLIEQHGFATVFEWVKSGGTKEMAFVTYRSNPDGTPDTTSPLVKSAWLDPSASGFDPAPYERAREGRWIKAKLRLSPANTPPDIGASPAAYQKSLLLLQADLEAVAIPTQPVSEKATFSTQIGILR